MKVLGINAVFHDPSAAIVVDGVTVAALEEERVSRRKHGKRPVPFSAWELPEGAARWCLAAAGLEPADLDAVAYSFDPTLARPASDQGLDDPYDWMRLDYARRAPQFLGEALPGLDPSLVQFVPHHVAHAGSAGLAGPWRDCAVLVLDGRGERWSHLAGVYRNGQLETFAAQELPHSLGLLYEGVTEHLGFLRSSDEYKVMALASYGEPRFEAELARSVYAVPGGGFRTERVDWDALVKRVQPGQELTPDHADLAASVQRTLEAVVLELARDLHQRCGARRLVLAGGVALNCVLNSRLFAESPFDDVWAQPAAGDAGTALGAAMQVAHAAGDVVEPISGADLGRSWTDRELEAVLRSAAINFERPPDIAETVARALADDQIVGWFQGASEFGPRALGHRSLLAHPGRPANLERLNDVKGREQFRPVAPMVTLERAAELFGRGPLPSPYMLFVHDVASSWLQRVPAVVHVDRTARVQTVDREAEPLLARMLDAFERLTGLPVVINTSFNTAGRPMVDSPRDALECFGSSPIDLLAMGPFAVRRAALYSAQEPS